MGRVIYLTNMEGDRSWHWLTWGLAQVRRVGGREGSRERQPVNVTEYFDA